MLTDMICDSQFRHDTEHAVSVSSDSNLLHFNPDPLSRYAYTPDNYKQLNSSPAVRERNNTVL